MADNPDPRITDESRLLLGAGFSFGVTCTLLLIGVVLATVGGGQTSIGSPVMITTGAGALFAGIVGTSLYLLAFSENRLLLPISTGPNDGE